MAKDLSELLQPTGDCLSLSETVAVLDGSRGDEAQQTGKTHVDTCAYCSAQLALFRRFESAQSRPEENPAIAEIVSKLRRSSPAAPVHWWKRAIWRPQIWIPGSLGMAAAAALLMMVLIPRSGQLPPPMPGSEDVLRSTQIVAVAPLGAVTMRPTALSWKPVENADTYRVRLFEVDRTELWSATVPSPNAQIPLAVQNKVLRQKKLLWDVTALDRSGHAIAQSGTASFQWLR
jgi:hypothetical protein